MVACDQQNNHFLFLHDDGKSLQQVSRVFAEKRILASIEGVFHLEDVSQALKKVATGGSHSKTITKTIR